MILALTMAFFQIQQQNTYLIKDFTKLANCKVREQDTKAAFTSDTTCKLVSKTTFSFDNYLEGLTEFTESSYTHSLGLLQLKDTD